MFCIVSVLGKQSLVTLVDTGSRKWLLIIVKVLLQLDDKEKVD